MSYPAVNGAWAIKEVPFDVVDDQGNTAVVLNRKEPTVQYQNEGCRAGVPMHGDALNYTLNAHFQEIQWLRECEVGCILEFVDGAVDLTQITDDRGGTWIDLGTISRGYSSGAVTIRAFQKTV